MSRWITLDAERVLYVHRGRDVILCDDHHKGPVTLVLKLADTDSTLINTASKREGGA